MQVFKALILIALFNVANLYGENINSEKINDISMIQLLSNPEKFHGKKVRVNGYLHNQFEDSNLFLSKRRCRFPKW